MVYQNITYMKRSPDLLERGTLIEFPSHVFGYYAHETES